MEATMIRASRALGLAVGLAIAAAAVNAAAPSRAEAQSVDINTPFTGQRPFQLDVHAGFTWWGLGFATGVRFGIPIVQNGFIDSLNNAVYLNFGADFYYTRCYGCGRADPNYYGFGLGFPVALHWEFYLNDNWSFFAELGFNFFLDPEFFDDPNRGWGVYHAGYWVLAAAGASFHISDNFLLTLRVGIPYAAFGLTFQF
jgi:hypothetical protein